MSVLLAVPLQAEFQQLLDGFRSEGFLIHDLQIGVLEAVQLQELQLICAVADKLAANDRIAP